MQMCYNHTDCRYQSPKEIKDTNDADARAIFNHTKILDFTGINWNEGISLKKREIPWRHLHSDWLTDI